MALAVSASALTVALKRGKRREMAARSVCIHRTTSTRVLEARRSAGRRHSCQAQKAAHTSGSANQNGAGTKSVENLGPS